MNTLDEANIQISGDLLNLLVMQDNLDQDLEGLTAQLREDWLASGASRPDPGFDVPTLATNIPAQCSIHAPMFVCCGTSTLLRLSFIAWPLT